MAPLQCSQKSACPPAMLGLPCRGSPVSAKGNKSQASTHDRTQDRACHLKSSPHAWRRVHAAGTTRPSVVKRTRKTSTAMPGMERHRQNLKISMPNLAFVRCFVTMLPRRASARSCPQESQGPGPETSTPVTKEHPQHSRTDTGELGAPAGPTERRPPQPSRSAPLWLLLGLRLSVAAPLFHALG